MERIIEVGEYKFPAKSTAASLFRYKSNFQRDAIKDLITLAKSMPDSAKVEKKAENNQPEEEKNKELGWNEIDALGDEFDLDIFFRFLWVFAKSADKGIPPFIEWLETFDMPPYDFAFTVLPQVSDMLMSTVKSSVKSKK